jgi:hypothetical protein
MGQGSERSPAGERSNEKGRFHTGETHLVGGGAKENCSVSTGTMGETEGGENRGVDCSLNLMDKP